MMFWIPEGLWDSQDEMKDQRSFDHKEDNSDLPLS